MRIEDALRLAAESDLDLVEVAPQAKPPVCKLMDYGKFKYEAAVKAREARKNQTNTVLKEIRFRLKIDTHDYETKRGHAIRFLGAGDKVKAMIQFRGREQQRPEMGIRLLQKFAEDVAEVGIVESAPRIDGRNMVMVIGPLKNKAEAKAEARRQAEKEGKDTKATSRPSRVDTSGNSSGPLTQSLADMLPGGLRLGTGRGETAPAAPAQQAPAARTESERTTASTARTESAAKAPAPRTQQRSDAPARTQSSRPAASPAPARQTPAPRPAAAAPAAPATPAAAPKPTPAPKPMAMPKPSAMKPTPRPKPQAAPKPGGRPAAPRSQNKPDAAE